MALPRSVSTATTRPGPFVVRTRRPTRGSTRPEFGVHLVLESEAALEPAATPGDLRRVQGRLLVLRHPHGHREDVPHPADAAEVASAVLLVAQDPGLVADADLSKLDARLEVPGEVLHELAEVHPAVGHEVEDDPAPAEQVLDVDEPHREPAFPDALDAVVEVRARRALGELRHAPAVIGSHAPQDLAARGSAACCLAGRATPRRRE